MHWSLEKCLLKGRLKLQQQQSSRHHIVPQFYLRLFAEGDRVVAIEINTERVLENQRIREIAFERNANTPEGTLLSPGVDVNNEISALEGTFAKALGELPDRFPPSSEAREMVSDFVLFQMVRDPRKRAQYGGISSKDHQLMALGLLMNDPGDPARRRILGQSGLLDFREKARAAISERCWLIYEAPAGGTAEFITTDSPVHLAGSVPDQRGLIRHADVHQLFLPLSRRHMLIMEQGSPAGDRKTQARVAEIQELNRKIVQSARRFAYAHPGIDRRWLKSSIRLVSTSYR